MRGATPAEPASDVSVEISIHAPHAGRDVLRLRLWLLLKIFQSTRPMRGATFWQRCYASCWFYFNPRAPCGARRGSAGILFPGSRRFQSTRPMRGATCTSADHWRATNISIHAPHAGRDRAELLHIAHKVSISIHAPHAGRDRDQRQHRQHQHIFQSTRPMRGATNSFVALYKAYQFQSTRPMRGATG